MLLIWGFKALYTTLGQGTFFCPNEGGDRDYLERQAKKWFTFFWIPLIPLSVLGDFVECTSCQSTYDKAVLTMPTTAQILDNLSNAARQAVVSVITADGIIQDTEKSKAVEVIQQYSDTLYTTEQLETDLRELNQGDLSAQLRGLAGTLNDRGKEGLITICLEVAAADGSIDESELVEIRKAGTALGMSMSHVRGVIAEAGDRLHLRSK